METFKQNFLVATQLIARDVRIIVTSRLFDDLISISITMFFFNFVFGSLGPLIGIDKNLVAATFLGTIVGSILFVGFARAIIDLADLEFSKFIDYRRILPISDRWYLGAHVASYVIHCLLTTLPILIIGKLLLGSRLDISHANWFLFFLIYFGVMILISAFFSCLVFTVSLEWFKFNIWQRVLTPMHLLGCLFYPWSKAYAFSPLFAQFLLLNPMTYCVEGMRLSLLGGAHFLSAWLCITVILSLVLLAMKILLTNILSRLDWVHYE